MNKLSYFVCASALAVSTHSFADSSLSEHVYNYDLSSGINYTTDASSGVMINGTTLKVGLTVWSDTQGSGNDTGVENQGSLDLYSGGYGLVNNDSNYDSHTIDNFQTSGTEWYCSFSWGRNCYGWSQETVQYQNDFDMILLSFSEDVALSDASFGWVEGKQDSHAVTAVGLDNIDLFTQNSASFSWSDVNFGLGSGSSKDHTGMSYVGNSTYKSAFSGLSAAKYWLVGAYNTYFDDNAISNFGTGFKLESIGFKIAQNNPKDPDDTDPTEVSEPGTLGIMLLGGALVALRRKRRS
ncbi:exosortase-dependent surface protein XDP1 [Alteromonas sp. H39]|uniref:exosortase-dependent surface protein XDP1 n=1 Tax=Alteromonas sp. H39 TaxID=3389876 RepID=UPI0039DFCD3E